MRALILPGLDGTSELLTEFVGALEPGILADVVAYPSVNRMDYDELAEFVERSLPDERLLLVAESFSGPVAIKLAAKAPGRFVGLVLCASFAAPPRAPLRLFRRFLRLPVPVPGSGLVGRVAMGRWLTESWKDRIESVIRKLRPEVARHRLHAIAGIDVSGELRRIRCPILYLQATGDRLVPAGAWARIQACAPDARLAIIDGPHFLLQANPRLAAAAIAEFARGIAH